LTKSGAASETTGGRFGAGGHLLQRHFRQRFARQGQRLPVTFNQLLTFAAVAFGNGALQFRQRAVARQDCVRWKNAICITVLIRAPGRIRGRFSPR
jgi:hypothetical protein